MPRPALVGGRVGRIQVLDVLGRGGMGEVYVGFDETLQRRVALKAIRSDLRLDDESRARFLREARMLSRLEHPNICKIHDYIESADSDFLVLELITGVNLAEASEAGLRADQRLQVAIQIAEVLEVAHGKGIVHRDLKPQNVMLTDGGVVKVLDFGLARSELVAAGSPGATDLGPLQGDYPAAGEDDETALLPPLEEPPTESDSVVQTGRGRVLGTPVFMSPEQARGGSVTTASDMYSFGLVLQALFSGRPPYPQGLGRSALLAAVRRGETLPVSGVDADLATLVERLKSAAPAARPTAVEARERLLWIRDKPKRRWRRLMAAAVLLVIVLATVKYTTDLQRARQAAELRRQQAEDLIGFMIGDLRTKLAPVNRLEVLDEIGEKARDYFSAVPASQLSSGEVLFRSRTLSQIGQVRMSQGDLPTALEAFEESLELAVDLAAGDPDNDAWQAWLGEAHFWVGSVFFRQGKLNAALRSFRSYLGIARELVAGEPEKQSWQLELSYAYTNVGSVLKAQGNLGEAAEAYRAAMGIKRRLVAEEPANAGWRTDLANSYSWLGDALWEQGKLGDALAAHRASLDILQALSAEAPANNELLWRLGIGHGKVGKVLDFMGRSDEAASQVAAYVEINEELALRDPDNSMWQRELAAALRRSGQLSSRRGAEEVAEKHLHRAAAIMQELTTRDPSRRVWRLDLGNIQVDQAHAAASRGARREAAEQSRAAAAIGHEILADHPGDHEARRLLARAYLSLGEVQREGADPAAARSSFEAALDHLEPALSGSQHPVLRELQLQALLALGRFEEARPIAGWLHAQGFRRAELVQQCREAAIWPSGDDGRDVAAGAKPLMEPVHAVR